MEIDIEALQRHKGRLLLIRAQLDVEIDELDALLGQAGEGCQHKERTEITAMGASVRKFYCRDCGEFFEEPMEEPPAGQPFGGS